MGCSGISTNIINLFCMPFLYNFCDRLIYKQLIIHCYINFHSCGGVRLNTLVPYLVLSLWYIPLLPLQSTYKIYGIMVKRDNRKYSERSLAEGHSFHHKSHRLTYNRTTQSVVRSQRQRHATSSKKTSYYVRSSRKNRHDDKVRHSQNLKT